MTGGPRLVIGVLGRWTSLDPVAELVVEIGGPGVALDRVESATRPQPGMQEAFRLAADRVVPSFGPDDEAAVRDHTAVAYVVTEPLARHVAAPTARAMLRVVGALFGLAGATAVKCESSGIAHGRDRWLALARTAAGSGVPQQRDEALVGAWVRMPLSDRAALYSCGMHLLGHPDVEMPADMDAHLAARWMRAVGKRSLDLERGELEVGSRLQVDGQPLRRVARRPCQRYPEDDLFHNPWGYWDLRAET